MAPESREILEEHLLKKNNVTYPVAELIMAFGFFLVLAIDQFVLGIVKHEAKNHKKEKKVGMTQKAPEPECKHCGYIVHGKRMIRRVSWPHSNMVTKISCGEPNRWDRAFRCTCDNYFYSHCRPAHRARLGRLSIRGYIDEDFKDTAVKARSKGAVRRLFDNQRQRLLSTPSVTDDVYKRGEHYTATAIPISSRQLGLVKSLTKDAIPERGQTPPPDSEESVVLQDSHSRRAIILMFALSFHRIFEGIGLGLQSSSGYLWNLFVAIMCHETVIGFSLGLQFVKNKWTPTRTAVTVFIVSLILPVGVICGTLMMELEGDNALMNVINGIIQCIATGTFIYVTFFEILGEEVLVHEMTKTKLLCAFIGFCSIAAIGFIPEEEEPILIAQNNHSENVYNQV